jgi:hypothetical protein
MSDLNAPKKEKVNYVFFSKYIQTLQVIGLKDERGLYFTFFRFSTAQSFMVDTLNHAVQV